MNNYEKKLDALIDALGFDVERLLDIKHIYRREDLQPNGEPKENAMPNCTIDNSTYKLTKRKDPLDVKYNGHFLRQLTTNIIEMECDPTLSKENKWIKYDKEQFDAVVHWFGDDVVMTEEGKCLIFDVEVSINE